MTSMIILALLCDIEIQIFIWDNLFSALKESINMPCDVTCFQKFLSMSVYLEREHY